MAALGPVETADAVEHRSFTGAIWANDGSNFSLIDIEVNIGQDGRTAKTKGYFVGFEQ